MVFVIVPVKEIFGPGAGILLTSEAFWIIGLILQSLELGFGVRIIVGNVRPGVSFSDTQICHQEGHRFGSHDLAAVGVDVEAGSLAAIPGIARPRPPWLRT